jgi:hypothetical protein
VLIMQIPITVSGLGTTQLAFDRLFIPQGAAPPQVFVFSILFLALGIIGTLPGGVLYAFGEGGRGSPGATCRGVRANTGRGTRGVRGSEGREIHGPRES